MALDLQPVFFSLAKWQDGRCRGPEGAGPRVGPCSQLRNALSALECSRHQADGPQHDAAFVLHIMKVASVPGPCAVSPNLSKVISGVSKYPEAGTARQWWYL